MDLEKMIVDNMGLVYHQLHRFNRAYDDEAYSHAVEALMKAAYTYDTDKNVKFSTYASTCIYNAIAMYLRTMHNRNKLLTVVSFDEPLFGSDDDTTYGDAIEDNSMTPDELCISKETCAVVNKAFDKVLSETTNKTTRRVAEYWRSTDYTASQMEMSVCLGISQPTVSRALSAFKHKLKLELEGYFMT